MFIYLEQILISFSEHVPLGIFTFIASFIEEVIPPIPSPSILIVAGSIASIQGYFWTGLFLIVFLGALGKTFGASVIYFVIGKVEDLFSSKINKFLGITPKQIESFGARLGKGWRDYIILIIFRALPIVPSSIISVGGSMLRIRFKLFVITTFIGSLIRDSLYIYIGFIGTKAAFSFIENTTSIESVIQIIAIIILVLFLGYLYYKRGKAKI